MANILKRSFIPISLLALIGLDLALLVPIYANFEVPVGWDTPVYICLIRDIGEKDVFTFLKENFYPHLYSFFGFWVNKLLIHDPFLTEKVLPIAFSVIVVLLLVYVVQRVFRDCNLSLLSGFFAVTSLNLIRMTADLHRNLMGLVFLFSTLLLAYEAHRKPSLKCHVMLLICWVLLIFTHIETSIFLILVAFVYEVFILKAWRGGFRKMLLNLSWLYAPLIIFFILLWPYSLEYVQFFYTEILVKQGLEMPLVTVHDIVHLLGLLGGINIPFVIFGLFRCVRVARKENPYGFLAAFSFSALVLGIIFLGLTERGFLFFPNSILGALGLLTLLRYLTRPKMNIEASNRSFVKNGKNFRVMVNVSIILLLILNVYIANIWAIQKLHPLIENKTYEALRWLGTVVEEPIVVMFMRESSWAGGTLEMYRNWIEATIGSNYVYVGRLQSLLHGYRSVFNHYELERFSLETWDQLYQLVGDDVSENLCNYSVIILEEFYSSQPTKYELGLLYKVNEGVYMLKDGYSELAADLYSLRLIPYLDFYGERGNWYLVDREWATTGQVLETYAVNPREAFYVSYRVLLSSNASYAIKLRLFDPILPGYAPITVTFDEGQVDERIFEITYSGTGEPIELSLPLGKVTPGFHDMKLSISDLSRPHLLSLEYIDFIPDWVHSDEI